MSRFIFDVHDDGPIEWGETSYEFADRAEIERRVQQLVEEAQTRQKARGCSPPLTTVFVHEDGGGIVLTAYARPGEDLRLVWASG
ncbi:hypothetical protein HCU64_22540 [Methylobacterium sp. C25]|uniref:hypothetical protein n=1 Tax=Methylobacterium sp. C25 TaxID=2721622 RepID=UPI001F1E6E17|nr:hypothetical protein [Methylobacterium sp. C25]MCE4226526.1 hypothetical protein [Methylobacterium sp. C25]